MANTARFESASEIVNTAAIEVGLVSNSAPYSSSDPAFRQLIKLLTVCGRELALMPSWNMQFREASVTVAAGQTEYDLPEDFLSMVDDTTYDGNSFAIGSVTPQMWTLWSKDDPSVTVTAFFRLARRKLVIPTSVPVGTVLSYEYRSRAWVISGTAVDVYKDKADEPGDIVLFEPVLVTRMLVFKFLRAKGFDSSGAYEEFRMVYDSVKSLDRPAVRYNLSSEIRTSRYLDEDNVPDSGFGG